MNFGAEEHDGHTIDVGDVHVLDDDGRCRPDCPHPWHDEDGLPFKIGLRRGDERWPNIPGKRLPMHPVAPT